ncbi:MAG: trigger factor [Alphaproteobacteria bacterium]|nr:trigger factor [Alphaproteobacteria bacterium]
MTVGDETLVPYVVSFEEQKTKVLITITLSKERIHKYTEAVVTSLSKELVLDGFRKGHVPPDIAKKHIDTFQVWHKAAQETFFHEFPLILAKEHLSPIGQPTLTFTKMPIEGDVECNVTFYVLPEYILPEYVSVIATCTLPEKPKEVTDTDVQMQKEEIRKQVYKQKNEGKDPEEGIILPVIDETFIKELGSPAKTIEEFDLFIKQALTEELNRSYTHLVRKTLTDVLYSLPHPIIPSMLIDIETERGKEEMKANLKTVGATIESYIEHRKISAEELDKELRLEAEKRAVVQIVINAIAAKEKFIPDEIILEKEITRLQHRYPEAQKEQVGMYVYSLLQNEQVFHHLETIAKNGSASV